MTTPETQSATPKPDIRWFHITPGHCLAALLLVEGSLLLAEWFRWIPKGWAVLIAAAVAVVVTVLTLLWFTLALIFRWRFQFSIRTLLVATTLIAVLCHTSRGKLIAPNVRDAAYRRFVSAAALSTTTIKPTVMGSVGEPSRTFRNVSWNGWARTSSVVSLT